MCCNGIRIILMFSLAILSFTLNNFIPSIPVILWFLLTINIFTFLLLVIDKIYSLKDRKRVPEMSLHFFSVAGGVFGALLAMLVAKHKIKKKMFLSIQILISFLWIISIYYVVTHLEAIQKVLQGLNS